VATQKHLLFHTLAEQLLEKSLKTAVFLVALHRLRRPSTLHVSSEQLLLIPDPARQPGLRLVYAVLTPRSASTQQAVQIAARATVARRNRIAVLLVIPNTLQMADRQARA
jgi:hypothetical protein